MTRPKARRMGKMWAVKTGRGDLIRLKHNRGDVRDEIPGLRLDFPEHGPFKVVPVVVTEILTELHPRKKARRG